MLPHNTNELNEPGINLLTIMGMLLAWTLDHIGTIMAIMVALSAIAVNTANFLKITFEEDKNGTSLWKLFLNYIKSLKFLKNGKDNDQNS